MSVVAPTIRIVSQSFLIIAASSVRLLGNVWGLKSLYSRGELCRCSSADRPGAPTYTFAAVNLPKIEVRVAARLPNLILLEDMGRVCQLRLYELKCASAEAKRHDTQFSTLGRYTVNIQEPFFRVS